MRWLSLLLVLAGCTGESAPASTQTVTDDLGRTVRLDRPVERVVTLAPSLTEVLFAAGAGGRLVGASTADDHPPAVDTLPRYSLLPMDFEALAALAPDLALATDQVNNARDAESLEALGIPTFFLSSRSLADVLQSIRTTGALLGTRAAADSTADALEARIAALRSRTEQVRQPPRVLFLIGDETLFAYGRGSYIHDLIRLAGGRSITADLPTAAPVLSDEFVLTARPDVIIGAFGEDYDPARLLARHPTWDILPAMREGRVYSIDPDLVNRPGPRLVEGAERMAKLLHPDLNGSRSSTQGSTLESKEL